MHGPSEQLSDETLANVKIYRECMQEIKGRLNFVADFLSGQGTTGSYLTNTEHLCLQFRKILELLALASIAPHKEQYAAQRKNFHQDWKAEKILDIVRGINPNFYPIPVDISVDPDTGAKHMSNVTEPYLTEDDFRVVFDKCNDTLHATNPFGKEKDLKPISDAFPEWTKRIQRLLKSHYITLIDGFVWIGIMHYPDDGMVHTMVGKRTGTFIQKSNASP